MLAALTDADLEWRVAHARDAAARERGQLRIEAATEGLEALLELRRRGTRSRRSAIDFALGVVVVEELRRLDRNAEALDLVAALRSVASVDGDRIALLLFEVLAGELLLDAVEFVAVDAYWGRVLGTDLVALSAVEAHQRARGAFGADPHCRNRGLRSLGRRLASAGRYLDAREVFEALLQEEDGWGLMEREAMILELAELHADSGEVELGEAALERLPTGGAMAETVRALLWLRAGRLSEAEDLLGAVVAGLRQGDPSFEPALSLRIQCLAYLNRLDEVDSEIVALRDSPLKARLGALLRARRLELDHEAWRSSAREALDTRRGGAGARLAAIVDPNRRSWRLREDFARVAAETLLACDAGEVAEARRGAEALHVMANTGQAEALRARAIVISALVALKAGTPEVGLEELIEAEGVYNAMGLRTEAWMTARVRYWCAAARGDDVARVDEARQRAAALGEVVEAGLSEEDRVFYRLNKWTQTDEALSAVWRTAQTPRDLLLETARLRGWARAAVEGTSREGDGDLYRTARAWLAVRQAHHPRTQEPWLESSLLPPDLAIVSFVCLPDRLEVAWFSRNSSGRLPVRGGTTRADVRARVGQALSTIRRARSYRVTGPLKRLRTVLALDILEESLPLEVRRLAIWADDVLLQVPWSAMPLTDDEPLVTRFVPTLLQGLRWEKRQTPTGPLIIVACEDGDDVLGLPHLPAVRAEAESLAALTSHPVIRSAAELSSRLPAAGVLHFACHGYFEPNDPLRSGLRLSDGWWTLREMAAHEYKIDTIVLSACWTGNAKVLPGREVIGVPQVLGLRGAQNVICTLLEVGDEASVDFVRDLHAKLNASAADALAECQHEAYRRGAPPSEWATYVCFTSALDVCGWWNKFRLSLRLRNESRRRKKNE